MLRGGRVVAPGVAWYGGDDGAAYPQLQGGVTRVIANDYCFCALKDDGGNVVWGYSGMHPPAPVRLWCAHQQRRRLRRRPYRWA